LHSSSSREVRVYAHCAKGRKGAVALAWLNIGVAPAVVSLPAALKGKRTDWVLTAGEPIEGAKNPLQSQQSLLNGVKLALTAGGALPPTGGKAASSAALELPPQSLGFSEVEGEVEACA